MKLVFFLSQNGPFKIPKNYIWPYIEYNEDIRPKRFFKINNIEICPIKVFRYHLFKSCLTTFVLSWYHNIFGTPSTYLVFGSRYQQSDCSCFETTSELFYQRTELSKYHSGTSHELQLSEKSSLASP